MAYAIPVMMNLSRKIRIVFACMLLATLLLAAVPTHGETDAPAAPGAPKRLQFRDDGTFTVLLIADLQSTQFVSPHLIRSLNGLFHNVDADLIVLLGDQLEGRSPVMRLGNGEKNVLRTLETLMAPIADSGIPFVFVFGNHDYDAPVAIQRQLDVYKRYPTYFDALAPIEGANAYGNYTASIPVYGGGGQIALNLYLFDCGPTAANGDYGAISGAQVDWYNAESARLRAENGGLTVPCVALSHIALPEVYELFTEAPAGTRGAQEGIGAGAGRYFLLDNSAFFIGEARELPCPSSVNNGLFDAFLLNDDVFLYIFGHDHVNSYIGSVRGVDMASVPGATFTGYNSRDTRGVRLFRFREDVVRDYDTLLVPFSAFDGAEGFGAVSYWLTTTTKVYKAIKVLAVSLLLIAALAFLIRALVKSDAGKGAMEDMPLEEEAYEQPEDDWL